MIKSFQKFESVRDMMTGRPEDDVRKSLSNMSPTDKISNGIRYGMDWAVVQGLEEKKAKGEEMSIPSQDFIRLVSDKNKKAIELLVNNGFEISKYGVAPTVVKLGDMAFAKYMLGLGVSTYMTIYFVRNIMYNHTSEEMEILKLFISKNKKVQGKIKQAITRHTNKMRIEKDNMEKYKELLS